MSAYFVVPDAHGNGHLVRALLEQEGIIEQDFTLGGRLICALRVKGPSEVRVVQLGDLANCVAVSINDDLDALDMVLSGLIDTMLVGNHEHPFFDGPPFSGFWPDPQVRRRLLDLNDRDLIAPSYNAAGVLLTHAGVHKAWGFKSASEANRYLNEWWDDNPTAPAFSLIGPSRSGGWSRSRYGGILWCDWSELDPAPFPQIVGHTVGDDVRRNGETVCLDLGCGKRSTRIAGCWLREGHEPEIVIHDTLKSEAVA